MQNHHLTGWASERGEGSLTRGLTEPRRTVNSRCCIAHGFVLHLTCCSCIVVPSVRTLEVDKAQRRQSQLDEAQVHEKMRVVHCKLLPFGQSPSSQVGKDGAEEENLHEIRTVMKTHLRSDLKVECIHTWIVMQCESCAAAVLPTAYLHERHFCCRIMYRRYDKCNRRAALGPAELTSGHVQLQQSSGGCFWQDIRRVLMICKTR